MVGRACSWVLGLVWGERWDNMFTHGCFETLLWERFCLVFDFFLCRRARLRRVIRRW